MICRYMFEFKGLRVMQLRIPLLLIIGINFFVTVDTLVRIQEEPDPCVLIGIESAFILPSQRTITTITAASGNGKSSSENSSGDTLQSKTEREETGGQQPQPQPQPQRQPQQRERPEIILHVGPAKTRTSTIQDGLARSAVELQADGYEYIGHNGGVLRSDGSHVTSELRDLLCLRNGDDNTPEQRNNLIGSNEYLQAVTSEYRQEWMDLTTTNKETGTTNITTANNAGCGDGVGNHNWDLRVVVTYRRLFEIIPSAYHQFFKKKRNIHMAPDLYGHRDWPGVEGNYRIPTLPEFLEHPESFCRHCSPTKEYSYPAYHFWGEAFPVSLFHFHQNGGLFDNFICHALPGSGLCRKVVRSPAPVRRPPPRRTNRSTRYIDCDILAVRAHEMGLVHQSDDRFGLVGAIGEFWKKLVKDRVDVENGTEDGEIGNPFLPKVCPDETLLAAIYDKAATLEAWAVDTLAAQQQQPHMRPSTNVTPAATAVVDGIIEDFEENWKLILDSEKLCSIDAPAALEQATWTDFFRRRWSSFESNTTTPSLSSSVMAEEEEEESNTTTPSSSPTTPSSSSSVMAEEEEGEEEGCSDSPFNAMVNKQPRDCAWIVDNDMCSKSRLRVHCRASCNNCEMCKDSPVNFIVVDEDDGTEQTMHCSWDVDFESLCADDDIAKTCRRTCGLC